jgi:hypothetical protein
VLVPRYRKAWTSVRRGSNARPSRWCVNWREVGGRKRRFAYPSRDAMLRAKGLIEQQLNSWMQPITSRTWPQLIEEYGVAQAVNSPSHRSKVANVLDLFYRICQPTDSHLITPAACERYFAARSAGDPRRLDPETGQWELRPIPAAATLAVEHAMLRAFFAWAVARSYLYANPIDAVARPRGPQRIRRAPREEQWLGLLRAIPRTELDDPQAWHLLILLALVTGLRQQALLHTYFGLPVTAELARQLGRRHPRGWSCVEFAGPEDHGIGLLHTYTGKTRKEQLFGLPPAVNDRLAARIAELPAGTTQLFPWARYQRKAWRRLAKNAGFTASFHSLRAACGTRAALARAAESARQQLAHASVSTTRAHYLDQEALAREVADHLPLPELPPLPEFAARHPAKHGRLPLSSEPSARPAPMAAPARSAAS